MACVEEASVKDSLSAESMESVRGAVCRSVLLQKQAADKLAADLRGRANPEGAVRQIVRIVMDCLEQVTSHGHHECHGHSHWGVLILLYLNFQEEKLGQMIMDSLFHMAEDSCHSFSSPRSPCSLADSMAAGASMTENDGVSGSSSSTVKPLSPTAPSAQLSGGRHGAKWVKQDIALKQDTEVISRQDSNWEDSHFVSDFLEIVDRMHKGKGGFASSSNIALFLGHVILSESAKADIKKEFIVRVVTQIEGQVFGQKLEEIVRHHESRALFVPIKFDMRSVPATQLTELLEVLRADSHRVCQTYAFLLAAYSGRWDVAFEVLQSGTRCLNDCYFSDYVQLFKTSFRHFARNAACILEFRCGCQACYDRHCLADLCVADFLRKEAARDETLLPQFLEECRQNELFAAGSMAALWGGYLKQAKQMAVRQLNRSGDIDVFLTTALENNSLRLLMDLTSCLPRGCHFQAVVCSVLKSAVHRCPKPGAKCIVKKLLKLCTDTSVLMNEVLYMAIELYDSDLFAAIVAADPVDLSQVQIDDVQGPVFATVVCYLSLYSVHYARFSAREKRVEKELHSMLKKCIESGLSTQHVWGQTSTACCSYRKLRMSPSPPFETAVRARQFNLAKILFESGATCNAELYRLSLDTQLRRLLEEEQKPLVEFIDEKASNPCSLEKTCIFVVSRLIGCRADRKERALSLGLPLDLVRRVLFFDLLFSEDTPL